MSKQLSEKQLAVLKANQFKKGEVQNPNGRQSPNKINQHIREILALAVEDNLPQVNKTISSLLKSENEIVRGRAVELFLRLMEFSTPRLQAMAVKTDGNSNSIIVIGKPHDLEPVQDSNDDSIMLEPAQLQNEHATVIDVQENNFSDDGNN